MKIELKEQLRAIIEALKGGHAGLSGPWIDALNRAASRLEERKDTPDDLARRLREHARALSEPGRSSIDELADTLKETLERV